MTYKQIYDIVRQQTMQNAILRVDDNAFIPFDPANTDYQQYLAWLAEGNTPLPADQGEQQ